MIYDLIIIGAGCAGLSAGIYAGRAKTNTLIIDQKKPGGQIYNTNKVVNYPGIIKTSGPNLIDTMKTQVNNFNVNIIEDKIIKTDFTQSIKKLYSTSKEYEAYSIIIATGAMPRILNFEGEHKFTGRGIAYCATCDGEFFEGLDIYVIGGGYAACEEAIYLTRYGKTITMLVRENDFLCAKTIVDQVKANPKIKVLFNVEVIKALGNNFLEEIEIIHNDTNIKETFNSRHNPIGLFIFAGYIPATSIFENQIELNNQGYVITNDKLETNIKGVYAAGDLRIKDLRQIVTAISDGAISAINAQHYLNNIDKLKSVKTNSTQLINDDLSDQLAIIFKKLELPVNLEMYLDDTSTSLKLNEYIETIVNLSNKLILKSYNSNEIHLPKLLIKDTNITWHGIPAGHELTPLILIIYYLSTKKYELDKTIIDQIHSINYDIEIKVGVTLICTYCPTLVQNIALIAIINPHIKLDIYDISLFNDFKAKYRIMSVPAMIINENRVIFGAKSVEEIIQILLKEAH